MVGLEDRQLGVGVDAAGGQQALLGAHEREVARRGHAAAGDLLQLTQGDHVLGQREPRDDSAHARDGAAQVAPCGLDPREPRLRWDVPREARERRAVRQPGRTQPAATELEVAQQRLHIGDVLRRGAAGRNRESHRARRAAEVALELTQVRDAGVCGEVGAAVGHLLQGDRGLVVAAELHERVDEHPEGLVHPRRERPGAARVDQRAGEVVSGELERRPLHQRGGVGGRDPQRAGDGGLGARVEPEVPGLPDPLEVRGSEQRPPIGLVGSVAHGDLQRGDALRRGGAGPQDRAVSSGRRRAPPPGAAAVHHGGDPERRREGKRGGDRGEETGRHGYGSGAGSPGCVGSMRFGSEVNPSCGGAT